jgi:hypothetical protein
MNVSASGNIGVVVQQNRTQSRAGAARIGSKLRGPGKLPPPYEDAPTEIWTQTRAEWLARCNGAKA